MNWPERGVRSVPFHSVPVETDESLDLAMQGVQEPVLGSIEEQSLEAPASLRSDLSLSRCGAGAPAADGEQYLYSDLAVRGVRLFPHGPAPEHRPQYEQLQGSSPRPQVYGGVMQEVSLVRPKDPGKVQTISLPEECKTVFITYSVDTAKEMIPFTKFLLANGFQPAIDIFDSPIRSMDTNKWMDRFLNDKSVLIIVVISPQYREDVEGHGPDEHRLHTKYIYKQIQSEFIQQGCLNFRLVPVLFPGASTKHVPNWLRSTRLYHWPQDSPDLLLRLFRMERYIVPLPGPGLTLSVQPI